MVCPPINENTNTNTNIITWGDERKRANHMTGQSSIKIQNKYKYKTDVMCKEELQ